MSDERARLICDNWHRLGCAILLQAARDAQDPRQPERGSGYDPITTPREASEFLRSPGAGWLASLLGPEIADLVAGNG